MRDKVDWWVVIKSRPRSRIDKEYNVENAYQDQRVLNVVTVLDNDHICLLVDSDGVNEEIDMQIEIPLVVEEAEEEENDDVNKEEEDEDEEEEEDEDEEDKREEEEDEIVQSKEEEDDVHEDEEDDDF
ncbi:hypothetical protein ACH5RR_009154 [Cinchona calisaya]|uniref:Uncharacterized protein n=1 Tax=Cinchona calisaya TaxID=153742 RepID=A0ABD3AH31_9GENT